MLNNLTQQEASIITNSSSRGIIGKYAEWYKTFSRHGRNLTMVIHYRYFRPPSKDRPAYKEITLPLPQAHPWLGWTYYDGMWFPVHNDNWCLPSIIEIEDLIFYDGKYCPGSNTWTPPIPPFKHPKPKRNGGSVVKVNSSGGWSVTAEINGEDTIIPIPPITEIPDDESPGVIGDYPIPLTEGKLEEGSNPPSTGTSGYGVTTQHAIIGYIPTYSVKVEYDSTVLTNFGHSYGTKEVTYVSGYMPVYGLPGADPTLSNPKAVTPDQVPDKYRDPSGEAGFPAYDPDSESDSDLYDPLGGVTEVGRGTNDDGSTWVTYDLDGIEVTYNSPDPDPE